MFPKNRIEHLKRSMGAVVAAPMDYLYITFPASWPPCYP